MTRVVFAAALLSTGCSSYYAASGHTAAAGALDELTTPDAGARYAALAAQAAGAARNELLGPRTTAAATELVRTVGDAAQIEVSTAVDTAGQAAEEHLSAILRSEQGELRQTVRLVIDEALSEKTLKEIAALREELAGAPLQADADALAPHLASAITTALGKVVLPVQAAADAEAARWRPIAVAFAVGCGLLLLCLGFAGWLIRGHQQTIKALAARHP